MALPPHSAERLKISIKDDGCPDDPLVSCFNGLEDPQQAARRRICGCTRKDPQPLRDARIYTIMLVTRRWQKQISAEEIQMIRKASAVWNGSLKEGKGTISTESGVLSKAQYSFSTRFENGRGTNPEELIAAAHAGCFTMALSAQLGNAGITPESLETTASVTLEKLEAGFTVTKVHLDVEARIPGADPVAFQKAAEAAEKGCPISRLLKAEITMNAKLLSGQAESA